MSTAVKKDVAPPDFDIPTSLHDLCSHDAKLVAWSVLQLARQAHDMTDAIDALHNRLEAIEASIDHLSNITERA